MANKRGALGGIISLQGGGIIQESLGAIIPLQTGGFVGIGKLSLWYPIRLACTLKFRHSSGTLMRSL